MNRDTPDPTAIVIALIKALENILWLYRGDGGVDEVNARKAIATASNWLANEGKRE